jgi:hypothetical protein
MDEKRPEELLDQATVDCYDEEEEFGGVLYSLQDNIKFPQIATVLGEQVEVLDIDDHRSTSS